MECKIKKLYLPGYKFLNAVDSLWICTMREIRFKKKKWHWPPKMSSNTAFHSQIEIFGRSSACLLHVSIDFHHNKLPNRFWTDVFSWRWQSSPTSMTCLVKHPEWLPLCCWFQLVALAGQFEQGPQITLFRVFSASPISEKASFSLLRKADRHIHRKVTLNQSQGEGLKTDKPFSASPELPPLSLLTRPRSCTWEQPLPLRLHTKKRWAGTMVKIMLLDIPD